MKIDIRLHARERMAKYRITEEMLVDCLENPDLIKKTILTGLYTTRS